MLSGGIGGPVGSSGGGIVVFATFTSATRCLCRGIDICVGGGFKLRATVVANSIRNGSAMSNVQGSLGAILAYFSPGSGSESLFRDVPGMSVSILVTASYVSRNRGLRSYSCLVGCSVR